MTKKEFEYTLGLIENIMERNQFIFKKYGFYDKLKNMIPTKENVDKIFRKLTDFHNEAVKLYKKETQILCDKYDKLLEDNKEILEKNNVKFNYISATNNMKPSGIGNSYYKYFVYKREQASKNRDDRYNPCANIGDVEDNIENIEFVIDALKKKEKPVKKDEINDIKKEVSDAIKEIIKTKGNNDELVKDEVSKFLKKYPKFIIKAVRKASSPLFYDETIYKNRPYEYNVFVEPKKSGAILF
jgi:arsenate reductase-like glutaredoxin family protein